MKGFTTPSPLTTWAILERLAILVTTSATSVILATLPIGCHQLVLRANFQVLGYN